MLRALENRLGALVAGWSTLADVMLRVLTSLIFIIGGLGHFFQSGEMLARMEESPWRGTIEAIGDPLLLLHLSGAVFIVAGLALVLGWMTRLACLAMFVTLIPITVTIHFAPGHVGPLFKNVAILGALFFMMVRGPGALALDNRS